PLLLLISIITNSQFINIEWQNCFGGSEPDFANDIIEVDEGFLILGNARSNDGAISFLHGGQDGWLIKTDDTGNLLWEKTYGGTYAEEFVRIFKSNDNNYYLLSSSHSSDGDVSYDPYPNSTDYWIVKIDDVGNILWDKIVGGEILDQIWTGTTTDDGGIVAFGWTGSTTGDVSVNYGGYDMWMIKLNSEGDTEWDFSLGTSGFDYGQAIIQTSDGGFLVGGSSSIGDGGNLTCEPFNYMGEAILVKLDADLNIEWQQCYGGSDNDGIIGLLELDDGYVFTAYGGSDDGDLTGSGWHGLDDIWVVRIDFLGNIIWQKCFGGSRYETARNIYKTNEGGYIVIGKTQSHDGDVIGNHTLSEYDSDIWLVKLNSEGELIWQQCIGGIGHEKVNFAVVKKSDVDFVIAGQTDNGPSYNVECTPYGIYGDLPDVWVFEVKDTTTAIQTNLSFAEKLKVYPNPARDYVVFEFSSSVISNWWAGQSVSVRNPPAIQITNIFGLIVENNLPITNGMAVWYCSKINPGLYFYRLYNNDEIKTGKIIIH
ncbi:MAG: T9SS type A sorting domain-containing protein, partial [Bacteroidetes bacterium]|nr:T9SS type A sorting domain-containing protein [Bacteroidota bacterium]